MAAGLGLLIVVTSQQSAIREEDCGKTMRPKLDGFCGRNLLEPYHSEMNDCVCAEGYGGR